MDLLKFRRELKGDDELGFDLVYVDVGGLSGSDGQLLVSDNALHLSGENETFTTISEIESSEITPSGMSNEPTY